MVFEKRFQRSDSVRPLKKQPHADGMGWDREGEYIVLLFYF